MKFSSCFDSEVFFTVNAIFVSETYISSFTFHCCIIYFWPTVFCTKSRCFWQQCIVFCFSVNITSETGSVSIIRYEERFLLIWVPWKEPFCWMDTKRSVNQIVCVCAHTCMHMWTRIRYIACITIYFLFVLVVYYCDIYSSHSMTILRQLSYNNGEIK